MRSSIKALHTVLF